MPVTITDAGIAIPRLPRPSTPDEDFDVQLVEFYNKCHNPTGTAGGQFCSDNVDASGIKDLALRQKLNSTAEIIGRIHDLPDSYPKAIVVEKGTGMGTADGSYSGENNTISMSTYADGKEITFVHEFGHHISLGEEGNYSLDQFQDKIDRTNTLRAWRDAVQASPTYENIRKRFLDDGEDYAGYLQDDRELFARSYAQWIARRSGNATLNDQMERIRSKNRDFQWSDAEFTPIAEALDAHFNHHKNTTASNQQRKVNLAALVNAFANDCCREAQNGQYCGCATGGVAVKKKRVRVKILPADKARFQDNPEAVLDVIPADEFEGQAYVEALKTPLFDMKSFSKGEDILLKQIRHAQGFDTLPQVVDQATFDKLEGPALYRGVGGPKDTNYTEQYRTGEHYAGRGIFGNGDYFTNVAASAIKYGTGYPKAAVLQAKIRPGARIATVSEITTMQEKAREERVYPLLDSTDPDARAKHTKASRQYYDIGTFAAANGIDVLVVDSQKIGTETYYVILNRGALVVSEEDIKA